MRFAIGLTLLAVGCATAQPISTQTTNNNAVRVDRLFDYDGCTVYRFYDGDQPQSRYFVKCSTATSTVAWQEPCGKGCVRDQDVSTSNVTR